jgi:hypothetical protein
MWGAAVVYGHLVHGVQHPVFRRFRQMPAAPIPSVTFTNRTAHGFDFHLGGKYLAIPTQPERQQVTPDTLGQRQSFMLVRRPVVGQSGDGRPVGHSFPRHDYFLVMKIALLEYPGIRPPARTFLFSTTAHQAGVISDVGSVMEIQQVLASAGSPTLILRQPLGILNFLVFGVFI